MSDENHIPVLTGTQRVLMAKFIANLRSGDFPQTNGVLRSKDGFCCLGVACETAAREGIPVAWSPLRGAYISWDPQRPYSGSGHASKIQFFKGFEIVATDETLLPARLATFFGMGSVKGNVRVRCREVNNILRCDHPTEDQSTCPEMVVAQATCLNDDLHWNFNQIADAFEQTYLGEDSDAAPKN